MLNFKRGISALAASRLQRWALFLVNYAFQIQYCSTKHFGYADGLSRLPSRFDKVFDESQLAAENQVTQVYNKSLLVTSKELSDTTAAGPNLTLVAQHIQNDWPLKIKNFKINLFFRKRSELFFHYGCIFWNSRVVISSVLRGRILNTLHSSHSDFQRIKYKARKYCFWSKLDNDIAHCVRNCSSCTDTARMPAKTLLQP